VSLGLPLVGAPVVALVLGAAVSAVRRPSPRSSLVLSRAGRFALQVGIVALGATMSLTHVASIGRDTLPVMLGTLAVALVVAVLAGRLFDVGARLQALIGIGTGICGASAIAAVAAVVAVTEAEIAYALSTVFALNVVAVLSFPPLGHSLGLSDFAFGVWAGTAVNDTSSVVAAGYAYGGTAGADAIVVKLARTSMIIPIVAVLAVVAVGRARAGAGVPWTKIVPWFLLWFAGAAAARTVGLVPAALESELEVVAVALLTLALAAVGLSTRLGDLRHAGVRPLLLGTIVWLAVAISSLGLQRLVGTW
jgi:uncharacterized integral membrane protein (TIGR00698 family)